MPNAYSAEVVEAIKSAEKSPGNQLLRLCVRLGIGTTIISNVTGASRPTIYRWAYGWGAHEKYTARIEEMLTLAKNCNDAEEVIAKWEKSAARKPSQTKNSSATPTKPSSKKAGTPSKKKS
jgi:hypothetical protein